MGKGENTRSGMLWEVERILKECYSLGTLPKILLLENVTQLHSKENMPHLQAWLRELEKLGYLSYWQDMNSADYGVPQHRDRTFVVSILGDYYYEFPKKFPLKLVLADMLEDEVDEKYYLSDQMIKYITSDNEKWTGNNYGFPLNTDLKEVINIKEATKKGYAEAYEGDGVYINRPHQKRGCVQKGLIQTLKTSPDDVGVVVRDTPKVVGGIGDKKSNGGTQYYQQDRIYDGSGIAMCHPANLPSGSYMYIVPSKNDYYFALMTFNKQLFETIEQNDFEFNKVLDLDLYNREVNFNSQTLTSPNHNKQRLFDGLRIRKLTPKECGRLMGVHDSDIDKMSKNQSNSSLYHLFGDSIVVDVLMNIFKKLL